MNGCLKRELMDERWFDAPKGRVDNGTGGWIKGRKKGRVGGYKEGRRDGWVNKRKVG